MLFASKTACPSGRPPRKSAQRRIRRRALWAVAAAAIVAAPFATADDLARETTPHRWVDSFMPEDLPPLTFPKYFKDFDKAEALAFGGRYKAALIMLGKNPKADPAELAVVRATCLDAIGRREDALAILSAADVATSVPVRIMKARILGNLGRNDEAFALMKETVAAAADSLPAHCWLGQFAESVGDYSTARDAYQWVYQNYYDKWTGQGAAQFDNAADVVLMGRAFDRWLTLSGGYQNNAGIANAILRVFTQAYDIIDTTYYPAHLAAAEYLIAHDNPQEALKELKPVLDANPNCIEAHALASALMVSQFNFDVADQQIADIRAVDAASPVAALLECRNLLQQRRPKDALVPVSAVLDAQPRNVEALGLLAAVYALQLREDMVDQTLARVEKVDPNNASAYYEVAEQLGNMRQYPRSAAKYQIAIDRAPWWTDARNGLGLLYTQSGDEDKARAVLDAAQLLDPFNKRTHNYLLLLDTLEKMDTVKTPHFVVRFDKKLDPVIPEYFGDYLESIYAQVTGDFKHEPALTTYIEVFPTHDAFSVRTTGTPYIGTVGASTGRVIALVSPRGGGGTLGTYDWSTVLRHEFTHTVTLSLTDNRIAHWLTEGLAVREEGNPLRWEWVPMLYSAVTKHELFPMDKLTWGFVRPKRPIDRQLAYAQSAWICQYIDETWGHEAMLKMLDEFRLGKEQDEVFQKILGKSLSQFSVDFFAWTEKQVATWGYDKDTTDKYDVLREQGEKLIADRKYKEAVGVWEQIAKLRPMDAMPHQRLAGLYMTDPVKDLDKAEQQLIRLNQVALKDNRFAKRIANIEMERKDLPKALQYGMAAVYIDPYDQEAHELLARIYTANGDTKSLEREKRVIPLIESLKKEWRKNQMMPGAPEPMP